MRMFHLVAQQIVSIFYKTAFQRPSCLHSENTKIPFLCLRSMSEAFRLKIAWTVKDRANITITLRYKVARGFSIYIITCIYNVYIPYDLDPF